MLAIDRNSAGLDVKSYKLTTDHKSQFTIHGSQITGHESRVTALCRARCQAFGKNRLHEHLVDCIGGNDQTIALHLNHGTP